jgi:hypothetical protein
MLMQEPTGIVPAPVDHQQLQLCRSCPLGGIDLLVNLAGYSGG